MKRHREGDRRKAKENGTRERESYETAQRRR